MDCPFIRRCWTIHKFGKVPDLALTHIHERNASVRGLAGLRGIVRDRSRFAEAKSAQSMPFNPAFHERRTNGNRPFDR